MMIEKIWTLFKAKFFSTRWYFTLGRAKINEFVGFIPEMLMIDLWLSNRGIDLGEYSYGIIPIAACLFILAGFLYKKSGLYDEEVKKAIEKNKIATEQLEMLRELHKELLKGRKIE